MRRWNRYAFCRAEKRHPEVGVWDPSLALFTPLWVAELRLELFGFLLPLKVSVWQTHPLHPNPVERVTLFVAALHRATPPPPIERRTSTTSCSYCSVLFVSFFLCIPWICCCSSSTWHLPTARPKPPLFIPDSPTDRPFLVTMMHHTSWRCTYPPLQRNERKRRSFLRRPIPRKECLFL